MPGIVTTWRGLTGSVTSTTAVPSPSPTTAYSRPSFRSTKPQTFAADTGWLVNSIQRDLRLEVDVAAGKLPREALHAVRGGDRGRLQRGRRAVVHDSLLRGSKVRRPLEAEVHHRLAIARIDADQDRRIRLRIPFLEMPAGLVAALRMHDAEQEALRIDAAHVVDAFRHLDGVARPRHRERVLDAPAGIVMLEAIRHVLAVRIDESRAERVVVRADRQRENDEAGEHRGQRGQ